MSIDSQSKKVAKTLLNSGNILIRLKIPFKFTSGILSPIYVDNRRLMSIVKDRKIITKLLVNKIKEIGVPDLVAGIATAGIPHAAWVSNELNIPMIYVRTERKNHGEKNQIEGILKRGQSVILIEDTISTAKSSVSAIKALREYGAKIQYELAIYSHTLNEANDNLKKIGVKFESLTSLKEIVEQAQKMGILRPDDKTENILLWAKDPKNWAKKMGY